MELEYDWNTIVRDLAPGLYRYFCASFSSAISEDLVQIALTRLFEKTSMGEFDPEKGHLRMYAYGIARNVRLEHQRNPHPRFAHQESIEELTSEALSPDQKLSDADEVQQLRDAIKQLSTIQQDVLGYRNFKATFWCGWRVWRVCESGVVMAVAEVFRILPGILRGEDRMLRVFAQEFDLKVAS